MQKQLGHVSAEMTRRYQRRRDRFRVNLTKAAGPLNAENAGRGESPALPGQNGGAPPATDASWGKAQAALVAVKSTCTAS